MAAEPQSRVGRHQTRADGTENRQTTEDDDDDEDEDDKNRPVSGERVTMASGTDNPHGGDVLQRRLRSRWASRAARLAVRGACRLAALLVALVLADLLLDWPLDLPPAARLALLAGNLAALAIGAHRVLFRHLRSYDPVEQAIQVERVLTGLNGVVISSVQFADESAFAPTVSRDLMRAVRRQAVERTAGRDLRGPGAFVPLRAAAAWAAAAVIALAAVGVWRGRYLAVLAARMFNPASSAAYPTDTTIELLGGEPVVRYGEPVELAARAGGVVPAAGELRIRAAGLDWQAVPLTAAPDATFRHVVPRATADVDYVFSLGDARSPRRRVTVVRPPRLVEARVHLAYPAYTRLTAQQVESLNLKVPEGTALSWRLRFDRPVLAVEMRPEGMPPRAMSLSADGLAAALQLPAEASRPYAVAFRWRLGPRHYTETGPKHYVQVIPDADPLVGMLRPTEDTKATLHKTVALSYWARDDYGLADAAIVYSVNDGPEQRFALASLAGDTRAERDFAWPITEAVVGLRTNDIVTFAVEVTDGRPGSPGRSRSISRRVQFVSDADYVAYVLARQRKFLAQLRPLYLQEKEAARHMESVAPGALAPPAAPRGSESRPAPEAKP